MFELADHRLLLGSIMAAALAPSRQAYYFQLLWQTNRNVSDVNGYICMTKLLGRA